MLTGKHSDRVLVRAHMNEKRHNDRIHIIDLVAHDSKTDEAVLIMNEPGEWDGSDAQLHLLQERFNAYASFLLDGELAETHPELAGKRARIELRCGHMPDPHTIDLLGMIRDQLQFQEVNVEVVVAESADGGTRCP
jgi:hypothetical protein